MAINITPSLGPNLSTNDGLVGTLPYWDSNSTVPSPALGTVVKGSDGHDYVFAQASAAVATNTVVILTEATWTFATGAGAWTAPTVTGGTPINQYAWLQRTLI